MLAAISCSVMVIGVVFRQNHSASFASEPRLNVMGLWFAGSRVLVSYALWEWVCFSVDPLFKRFFNAYECFAHVCAICMPGARGDQNRATHPITGVTDVYKLPCASWEPNLGLLKEAFLTPELSPQPLPGDLLFKRVSCLEIFLTSKGL